MKQSRQPDLNHVKSFFSIARSGSLTQAAKILGIPKSTLSQHLKSLESHLGSTLIQRTTRRLVLTEAGTLFLAYCERAMAELEDAEHALTQYRSEPRGLLRVGVPVTFARSFLSPLLPAFCKRYPDLKIQLVIPGKLDPVAHSLDVVIRVGRIEDSSYIVKKLGEVPQRLFATKTYLRANGSPKSPADLPSHSIIAISREPQGAKWHLSDANGKQLEVKFEPRLTAADPVVATQLAAANMGITMVPGFLAAQSPNLFPVLPKWNCPSVEFFALFPARDLTPPKLRAFLDMLEAGLPQYLNTRSPLAQGTSSKRIVAPASYLR